jgi:cytoskeletal protein RodZ
MKSLGEKLTKAREAKGLTIENVSRDTNIARRYLAALEEEDFLQFPATSYAIGFLRNYGEYLGLDTVELLSLYRAIQIQEQPVPIEQLLKKKSPLPAVLTACGVGIVVLVAAFFVYKLLTRTAETVDTEQPLVHRAVEHSFAEGAFVQRLYPDDAVLVEKSGTTYRFVLRQIGDSVTIASADEEILLDLVQTKTIDLNKNGSDELSIQVTDFSKNNPEVGALLRFELFDESLNLDIPSAENIAVASGIPNPAAFTIFTSSTPYPFTLQISFQGYCMFRWEILREANRSGRTEQYFSRGQEFSIDAQNGIRIWVSNAASAKVQIIGGGQTLPLTLGAAGEIIVSDVHWLREEGNRYRLVLARLES